jgi:hypothetical protein
MGRRRFAPLIFLLLAALLGCAPRNQKVIYDLDDVAKAPTGPLSAHGLVVEPLVGGRDEAVKARRGSDLEPAVVQRDGDDWHFNGDDHYGSPVVPAVTEMLAQHLAATGLFKSVRIASTPGEPDELRLSGTLRRFESYMDRYEGTRAMMNQGGLFFLAAGAVIEARYDADVRIEDLRLLHPASGRVLWEGEVEGTASGGSRLIASTHWEVYQHANEALKAAVTKLAEELRRLPADELNRTLEASVRREEPKVGTEGG